MGLQRAGFVGRSGDRGNSVFSKLVGASIVSLGASFVGAKSQRTTTMAPKKKAISSSTVVGTTPPKG